MPHLYYTFVQYLNSSPKRPMSCSIGDVVAEIVGRERVEDEPRRQCCASGGRKGPITSDVFHEIKARQSVKEN